eukprot:338880_1
MKDIFHDKNQCHYESLTKETQLSFDEFSLMDYWSTTNPIKLTIKQSAGVVFMLDRIYFGQGYQIIKMNDGVFVFTDTILNQYLSFIYSPTTCQIICFDILQNYSKHLHYITQLHVECTKSINKKYVPLSLSQSSYINHASPYYIDFIYNKTYVVDSDLIILFNVTDRFGNIINDYGASIIMQFKSAELSINYSVTVNIDAIILLQPITTNEKANANITIKSVVNNNELKVKDDINILVIQRVYDPIYLTDTNEDWLYLLFVLLIPCIIIIVVTLYCRYTYMNALIIDKALVLIIGISEFDGKETQHLPGVVPNVKQLTQLWLNKYKYDVFVCNMDTTAVLQRESFNLKCTKNDVINFIDLHKTKLYDNSKNRYKAVIVHVVTHGDKNDAFFTSDFDAKKSKCNLEMIRHELIEESELGNNTSLIKLLFHHGCRGNADHHLSRLDNVISKQDDNNRCCCACSGCFKNNDLQLQQNSAHNTRAMWTPNSNNNNNKIMAGDSNCVTVYGTISGRAMSDSGYFTQSICHSFGNNAQRRLKQDFVSLLIEIGTNLELKTNKAEICTTNGLGTLRYNPIRYEICARANKSEKMVSQIPMVKLEKSSNKIDIDHEEKMDNDEHRESSLSNEIVDTFMHQLDNIADYNNDNNESGLNIDVNDDEESLDIDGLDTLIEEIDPFVEY